MFVTYLRALNLLRLTFTLHLLTLLCLYLPPIQPMFTLLEMIHGMVF